MVPACHVQPARGSRLPALSQHWAYVRARGGGAPCFGSPNTLIRAAMSCFRYVTPVVKGRWRGSEEEALSDALEAGQAYMSGGRTILFEFARIEHGEPGACCPEVAGNPGDLRAQAAQCRWLAKSTSDERTTRILLQMANKYEERAGLLDPHPDEAPVIILEPE